MSQIIPFPTLSEDPTAAFTREDLLAQVQALQDELAALDEKEPQDMMSTQYARWGARHEALEDELDDLLELLEE